MDATDPVAVSRTRLHDFEDGFELSIEALRTNVQNLGRRSVRLHLRLLLLSRLDPGSVGDEAIAKTQVTSRLQKPHMTKSSDREDWGAHSLVGEAGRSGVGGPKVEAP